MSCARCSKKRRGRVIVVATIRSDYLNELQTRRLNGDEVKLKYATVELDALPKDYLTATIRLTDFNSDLYFADEIFQREEPYDGPCFAAWSGL